MQRSVHGPAAVYYLLNWFHEERNAGDPSFLRIMKPSPPGCFYPYAQVSGNRLESGRSEGDVVWYLSRHVRLVAMVQEYTQIFRILLASPSQAPDDPKTAGRNESAG